MARQLKPMQVDTYHDKGLRIEVPIMLDRNTKEFFVEVETEELRAPSVAELKPLLAAQLANLKQIEWVRKIYVEIENPEEHHNWSSRSCEDDLTGGRLVFDFDRMEIAKTSTGKWISRSFAEDLSEYDAKQRARDPFHYSDSIWDAKRADLIDYSDEVWASLRAIAEATRAARKRLSEILDPKDKGKKLLALGSSSFALLGAREKASSK